ncbi:MAG: DsbA family oxidoreductase [Chloroflexota bacterium]
MDNKLHVWHDYVCPFSYVAATRIARIKAADHLQLDVRFHPWPLATHGSQPTASQESAWVRQLRTIEPDAFVHWNPSSGFWPIDSTLLFQAYEAAAAQSFEAAEKLDLLIRRSIFQHPRPLGMDELSRPASEAGLDVGLFRAMLEDGAAQSRVAPSVQGNGQIRGIPTLLLPDGRTVLNPGLKIVRAPQGRAVCDDVEVLRALLAEAAGAPA